MKRGRVTTTKQFLVGGPWSGQYAVLPPITMVFRVGVWRGFYSDGEWVNV